MKWRANDFQTENPILQFTLIKDRQEEAHAAIWSNVIEALRPTKQFQWKETVRREKVLHFNKTVRKLGAGSEPRYVSSLYTLPTLQAVH